MAQKTFWISLRLIDPGNQNSDISRPLQPEAFYKFNALATFVGSNRAKSYEYSRRTPGGDKGLPFRENLDEDSIKAIIGAFKMALKDAVQGRTLVLALDDLTKTWRSNRPL